MARDAALETLIRATLAEARIDAAGLTDTTMFGGRAWLFDGHLICGARHDGMLVRLGKGNDAWALDHAGIAPMQMGTRRMHGWVRASPEAAADAALRHRLIDAALAFVRTLPAK